MNGKRTDSYSFYFLVSSAVFITCLLTSNIIAVKLIRVSGFILPAAIIIFPISYIFGDILTEVYGYSSARKVIWLGFFCNLIFVVAAYLARILPPYELWREQEAFEKILGFTPRLLFASFLAYVFGEFSNSYVLAKLKILTGGRFLWIRTISSTIVGQGIDSSIFIFISFFGLIPGKALVFTIFSQWITKVAYEVLFTPLTYLVVNFLKRKEGIDTFDYGTRFSPFAIKD